MRPIYLYITPFFPSPQSWRGGYCLDAVKALEREGKYDVRVLVIERGEDYLWEGIAVTRLAKMGLPCDVAPFLFDRINAHRLMKKLKQLNIDPQNIAICHAHTLKCALYARALKKVNPAITTLLHHHYNFAFEISSGRLGLIPLHATLLYRYLRTLCESIDTHLFVSEKAKATFGQCFSHDKLKPDVRDQLWLGRFLRPLQLQHTCVRYNEIDPTCFYPRAKVPHDTFVIGCVANFYPRKDQQTLLRAVALLKDKWDALRVRFVGSGPTLEACKATATALGLASIVSFEPEMDHCELPHFYAALDLFVLPSYCESFGCVYTEAWSCGTPFIACEDQGIAELIFENERHLWLCKPQDPHDLADKIAFYATHRPQQRLRAITR